MLPKANFFWLRRFAKETPFHGYGLASGSFNWYEFSTWLLIIVFCSIMTIWQTITLIGQYDSQPSVTAVTVIENASIVFDNAVLCYELTNNFPLNTNITKIEELLAASDLSILNNTDGNLTAAKLHPDIMYLITEMILEITTIEFNLNQEFQWGRKLNAKGNATLPSNLAVDQVYKHLRSKNLKFMSMLRVLGSLTCRLFNISVINAAYNFGVKRLMPKTLDICTPDNIMSFTKNGLCIRVRGKNNTLPSFSTSYDYLLISSNPENFHKGVDHLTLASMSARLDLLGRSTKGNEIGGTITVEYFEKITLATELQAKFQLFNLRRRPCSNDISKAVCHSNCAAYFIYQTCGCWPLTYISSAPQANIALCTERSEINSSAAPYHLIPTYSKCLANVTSGTAGQKTSKCHDECHTDCGYNKFGFAQRQLASASGTGQFVPNPGEDSTVMQLQIADVVFPLFEEFIEKKWENFLSEFGGTIGIWLGGSLIAIVHVPLFIAKVFLSLLAKRKQSRKDSSISPATVYS